MDTRECLRTIEGHNLTGGAAESEAALRLAQAADEAIRRIHEARDKKSTTGWVLKLTGGGKKTRKAPPHQMSTGITDGAGEEDVLSFWKRHPMSETFRSAVVGRIAQEERTAMSAAEAD